MSDWLFEDGHLVAENEDGHELGKWKIDHEIETWNVEIDPGAILASIFDANQCLSNQLLKR